MRRLLRILLNVMTVLSLLLCLATAAIWVRSYWAYDRLIRKSQTQLTRDMRGRPVRYWQQSQFLDVTRGVVGVHWSAFPKYDQFYNGSDEIVEQPVPADPNVEWTWVRFPRPSDPDVAFWRRRAFKRDIKVWPPSDHMQPPTVLGFAALPLWAPFAASAVLPAAWAARHITRRRRQLRGHCPHCGYDLRATPERCPECGTIPAK